MSLDQFELLELRRDGGVRTYHAREIATARPVQVHLVANGNTEESAALLGMVHQLPETERRRVIDCGEAQGWPYVVTDRLAGYVDFRDWVTANSGGDPPGGPARPLTLDEQFFRLFDPPAALAPAAVFKATEPEALPGLVPLRMPAHPIFLPVSAPEPREKRKNEPSISEPGLLESSIEVEAVQPPRRFLPTAAKSLLWLVLGVLAALLFLTGLLAFFAFRPR